MNYPTAERLARAHGTPVTRASWNDSEEKPTAWLTFEMGAFYLYTATARSIITASSLSEADFRAKDWYSPSDCPLQVSAQPDIGGQSQATEPTFDILSPPCRVG